MSAQVILGFAFALLGMSMTTASWFGRSFFVDSRKDDHVVLWIGEEGARLLDVALGACFALGGLWIAFG